MLVIVLPAIPEASEQVRKAFSKRRQEILSEALLYERLRTRGLDWDGSADDDKIDFLHAAGVLPLCGSQWRKDLVNWRPRPAIELCQTHSKADALRPFRRRPAVGRRQVRVAANLMRGLRHPLVSSD